MPSPVWGYIADRPGMCVFEGAWSTEDTLLHGTVEAENVTFPCSRRLSRGGIGYKVCLFLAPPSPSVARLLSLLLGLSLPRMTRADGLFP